MKETNLTLEQALLRRLFLEEASTLAFTNYGCDLDRLYPSVLERYADGVTEENMEELAEGLADAAWQAY